MASTSGIPDNDLSRESEERYRTLFTHAPFPIGLIRAEDSVICDVNEAHERFFGYSRHELIGRTAIEVGLWEDPSRRDPCMEQFRREGFVHEFPVTVRTRFGELRQILLSLRPITINGQGYLALFCLDITHTHQVLEALAKSESMLRALLNALPDPVWLKDAQGRFLAVNSAWASFTGVKAENAIGKHADDLFPPHIATELDRQDEQLMAHRQIIRIDEAVPDAHGIDHYFETTKNVADNGQNTIGTVGIARDVTANRQARAELAAKTEGYEARLRALSIEASLAEERERRNLAGLLHDDVCQLLAVAGMKLSLARQTPPGRERDRLVAEAEEHIARGNRAARSLMLQLSHPALYDLGIAAAAEWLAEDVQRLYGVKVSFVDDGKPKPLELPMRVVLFQCLRELLVNAAKHSGMDSVDVNLVRDGDVVRLLVHDTGRGFDPETVETRAARGFGFFSVRTRLTNLGGKMQLQSAPGEGTTVRLEIPLPQQPREAANGASTAGR